MTKCYGHEECEFNAQPNCALPNGMRCPHRVKADKPAVKSWLDIEAQIEKLNQYSQSLIAYQMGVEFADVCMDVAAALSTLQAENEKLKNAADSWKKKWAGLDKAVRNGSVYRPMQEELNLTHEENQSLKDVNEKLRAELDSVKCERDAAIKDLFEIIGDIEEIRCEYDIHNSDADDAYMNLCGIYCANEGYICYKEDENYRCKNFEWRGPQKGNI